MRDSRPPLDSPERRLLCLDGLRGLLALHVVVGHMVPFAAVPVELSWLRSPFRHGQAAVDVFFMLSGFVILRSLRSHGDGGAFLRARAWRTYPAYLAALAVALPLQMLPSGLDAAPWAAPEAADMASGPWPEDAWARLAAHLTMTHGMFPDSVLPDVWVCFLGPAWSLSVEWQFYAVLVLLGGARRGVWALACVFLVAATAGAAWQAEAPAAWRFSRAFLPDKAEYFALGIASAGVAREGGRRRYACVLAATLLLCAGRGGQIEKLLPPLLWTVCLSAQLGAPTLRPLARVLASPQLLRLGAISYSLYLINEPVQQLLLLAVLPWVREHVWLFDAVWLPGAVLLPVLVAKVLNQRIEQPGIRHGRRPAAAAAPGLSAE